MSKIKKIEVGNLKAISAMAADFNGCTAIITGGNNKGKSSFLKSLIDRIRGAKTDSILKQGERQGFAELELTTGERFTWTFNDKAKEKLTFTTERNISTSVTRDLAKSYFPETFDVDAFLNSTPAKQKAVLQKITGIDFTEIDKAHKEAYENRTYFNKQSETEKAKTGYVDPKLPKEMLPTDEIEQKINGVNLHNLKIKQVVDGISYKTNQLQENENEITALAEKITALQGKNEVLESDILKGNAWVKINIPITDKTALIESLAAIKEQNKEIENNNAARLQEVVAEVAKSSAIEADREVKRLEAEKLYYIKSAKMPEGFGFSDDGVTYEGFAFDKNSLSSSKIYIAALKLAAVTLGEVKTLHFDASFLDKNSLSQIETWANETGLQLLIERPDFEGGEIEYQIVNAD